MTENEKFHATNPVEYVQYTINLLTQYINLAQTVRNCVYFRGYLQQSDVVKTLLLHYT